MKIRIIFILGIGITLFGLAGCGTSFQKLLQMSEIKESPMKGKNNDELKEKEFNKVVEQARVAMQSLSLLPAESFLKKADELYSHHLPREERHLFYQTKLNFYLQSKNYDKAIEVASLGKKELSSHYASFYNIQMARALWYKGNIDESFKYYMKTISTDFISFRDDDCIILSQIMDQLLVDFEALCWADHCREFITYIPQLYEIAVRDSVDVKAILIWAEMVDYLLSSGRLDLTQGDLSQLDISTGLSADLVDHELFSLFIDFFVEGSAVDESLASYLEQNREFPFCQMLLIEQTIDENRIEGETLSQALALEKSMGDFPRYHLMMSKLMIAIDPLNQRQLILPLLDYTLDKCWKGSLYPKTEIVLSQFLKVPVKRLETLIPLSQMRQLVEGIQQGADASTILPLIEIISLDLPLFSQFAFQQLKKVSNYRPVYQMLTFIQTESNEGGSP